MILEMHDICKDYDLGRNITHVLKNVNLEVDEGEYLAIMGPSGSGKTTLMNLIGCLDTPTSGQYIFAGNDIMKCSARDLADIRNRRIGFIFQSFNLLPGLSALENVALPLLYGGVRKKERRERALEALKTVGLEERVDYRPDQLSGGQCQRVAIARAIISRPDILLADEPTGALDSENGAQVMELFKGLHDKGSTIIMITHDSNIASYASNIKYIYDGILTDEPYQASRNAVPGGDRDE
ncbi:MAG: ABC transporter ATP-binding protein [Lachnospiraceae bacterium]|nr:ABC transporter ATP-binding protein [Lachnospiraceae bacterium]